MSRSIDWNSETNASALEVGTNGGELAKLSSSDYEIDVKRISRKQEPDLCCTSRSDRPHYVCLTRFHIALNIRGSTAAAAAAAAGGPREVVGSWRLTSP